MAFESNKKYPVNIFLTKKGDKLVQILIFSNQMIHIETIDVRFIEAVILHQNQSSVFALKIHGSGRDYLIESNQRTEFLFHLISVFEKLKLEKFKVYASKNISIKQLFDVGNVNPGSYEDNLSVEQLSEKKELILKHIKERLRMSFVNFNQGVKDPSQIDSSS